MGKRSLDFVPIAEPTPEPTRAAPRADKPLSAAGAEIIRERAGLMRAAEEIISRLVDGAFATPDERACLCSLNLDGEKLENELRRVRQIRANQRLAGSGAEREQAASAAAAAAEKLATARPEIAAEMLRLQQRLADLETAAEVARAAAAGRAAAVEKLRERELLPSFARSELSDLQREYGRRYDQPRRTLENDIAATPLIAAMDPASPEAINHARSIRGEFPDVLQITRTVTTWKESVDPIAWAGYLVARKQADEKRQAEIAAIDGDPERIAMAAQIEKIVATYIPV
jgi:hypothetical protein